MCMSCRTGYIRCEFTTRKKGALIMAGGLVIIAHNMRLKKEKRKGLQVPELTGGGPALRELLEELRSDVPAGPVGRVPSNRIPIVFSAYALVRCSWVLFFDICKSTRVSNVVDRIMILALLQISLTYKMQKHEPLPCAHIPESVPVASSGTPHNPSRAQYHSTLSQRYPHPALQEPSTTVGTHVSSP